MSNATYLGHVWQDLTGDPAAHSARTIRDLQLSEQMPVGKRGKAALLNGTALAYFVLAVATGNGISTASIRAATWGGIVRDYKAGVSGRGRSQPETSWRAWRDTVVGEAEVTNPITLSNILPGATLLEGVAALLDRMADSTPNVPLYGDREVTFTELLSYLQFRIDLRVGESDGPTAIVSVMGRTDRYSMQVQPTVARCPIKSVITIEVRHLVALARVLEAAKARTISATPAPPVPPASPAGPGNGNAGAVPTAPAPTPDHPSSPNDHMVASAHSGPARHSPEPKVCGCGRARAAGEVSPSRLAHGASLDDFLADFDTPND